MMALDLGDKRIGVATCDAGEVLATPLTTIQHTKHQRDIQTILALAVEQNVEQIVVGMPVSLSGDIGPQAKKAGRFAEKLASQADIPVEVADERYSTVDAQRLLYEAGGHGFKDRGRIDSAAAAVILQYYIDSRRARTA